MGHGPGDMVSFTFASSRLPLCLSALEKPAPEAWLFSRIQIENLYPSLPWPLRMEQPRAQRSILFASLELSVELFTSCLTPGCSFRALHTGHQGVCWPESYVPTSFMLHVAFALFQIDTGSFSSRKPLYPIFPGGWLIGLSRQPFLQSYLGISRQPSLLSYPRPF